MQYKYIHIIAAFFLIVGMGVQAYVSYSRAKFRLQEQMDLKMELMQEHLKFELFDANEAKEQLAKVVAENIRHPELLLSHTREFMGRYPTFSSCYIAFPPYYFPDKGKWYCLSSYRKNDSIYTELYGDAEHDYFSSEWYLGALQSGSKGYWSQPYHDEAFDEPIFTHSDDVRDSRGKLLCVIGLDFSVNWTKRLLEQYSSLPEVVVMLFSSNGTLLAESGAENGWEDIHETDDGTSVTGDGLSVTEKNRDWIITRKTMQPVNIDLVTAVPKKLVWKSLRLGIFLPLGVFVMGILVVGLLIRRLLHDEHENARLGTSKKLMEHELQIAHDIQMGMLKGAGLSVTGEGLPVTGEKDVELSATLLPMREVGGDLYDFHREGDHLWFIIGDVSGKGVPAAMFMSAAVNLFRAAGKHACSPKEIMEEINAVLSENNPSLIFVTAFIGRLHVPSGQLLYCNAGHCEPIVVDSRRHQALRIHLEPNIPLGYDGRYAFVEQGCMLGEGDRMVLYTDGVTEARNSARKMLGMQQWMQFVLQDGDLLQAVKRYIGDAEPTDDITLMTIRKLSAVQPVTMRVPNRDDQWPAMRRTIHEFGLCLGMERRQLKKLEVAAEEAVVNIARYSEATELTLQLAVTGEGLPVTFSLTLTDDGVPFDPTACTTDAARQVDERQIGGLGISLIRQIADELRYQRIDNTNQLTIIKNI